LALFAGALTGVFYVIVWQIARQYDRRIRRGPQEVVVLAAFHGVILLLTFLVFVGTVISVQTIGGWLGIGLGGVGFGIFLRQRRLNSRPEQDEFTET
jgi:hypothetical protein